MYIYIYIYPGLRADIKKRGLEYMMRTNLRRVGVVKETTGSEPGGRTGMGKPKLRSLEDLWNYVQNLKIRK
jgi:hypothetical protein